MPLILCAPYQSKRLTNVLEFLTRDNVFELDAMTASKTFAVRSQNIFELKAKSVEAYIASAASSPMSLNMALVDAEESVFVTQPEYTLKENAQSVQSLVFITNNNTPLTVAVPKSASNTMLSVNLTNMLDVKVKTENEYRTLFANRGEVTAGNVIVAKNTMIAANVSNTLLSARSQRL